MKYIVPYNMLAFSPGLEETLIRGGTEVEIWKESETYFVKSPNGKVIELECPEGFIPYLEPIIKYRSSREALQNPYN